jgi:hypothetical protein
VIPGPTRKRFALTASEPSTGGSVSTPPGPPPPPGTPAS